MWQEDGICPAHRVDKLEEGKVIVGDRLVQVSGHC